MTTTHFDPTVLAPNQESTTRADDRSAAPSKGALWGGRVLSGLGVLFLAFDGVTKIVQPPEMMKAGESLGWSLSQMRPIGILQIALLAIYLFPRTAVLGAVLWTGYLGGAVASHVRVDNPLFSHTLFPTYVAALLWGGLWLRDARVRGMLSRRA